MGLASFGLQKLAYCYLLSRLSISRDLDKWQHKGTSRHHDYAVEYIFLVWAYQETRRYANIRGRSAVGGSFRFLVRSFEEIPVKFRFRHLRPGEPTSREKRKYKRDKLNWFLWKKRLQESDQVTLKWDFKSEFSAILLVFTFNFMIKRFWITKNNFLLIEYSAIDLWKFAFNWIWIWF